MNEKKMRSASVHFTLLPSERQMLLDSVFDEEGHAER